jgi:hypothetical protein
MNNDDQFEFKIGEDEQAADVEVNDETGEAKLQTQEEAPIVEQASNQQEEELEQYSDKVKKRIDKMTARLREAQRREDAALEYAKNVQSQLNQANQRYQTSDQHRMAEAKSRIETQSVALKQIMRKAREEGDVDTEMEAQERLAQIAMEQRQLQQAIAEQQTRAQQAEQPVQHTRSTAAACSPAHPCGPESRTMGRGQPLVWQRHHHDTRCLGHSPSISSRRTP